LLLVPAAEHGVQTLRPCDDFTPGTDGWDGGWLQQRFRHGKVSIPPHARLFPQLTDHLPHPWTGFKPAGADCHTDEDGDTFLTECPDVVGLDLGSPATARPRTVTPQTRQRKARRRSIVPPRWV
jgi:hypothetical protein